MTLEAIERVRRLEEALTPSGDTKADYHGEFYFMTTRSVYVGDTSTDNEFEEVEVKEYVPWTTVKEIMARILARANRPEDEL